MTSERLRHLGRPIHRGRRRMISFLTTVLCWLSALSATAAASPLASGTNGGLGGPSLTSRTVMDGASESSSRRVWRGGDNLPTTENNDEIDAYIDHLVASVPDSEDDLDAWDENDAVAEGKEENESLTFEAINAIEPAVTAEPVIVKSHDEANGGSSDDEPAERLDFSRRSQVVPVDADSMPISKAKKINSLDASLKKTKRKKKKNQKSLHAKPDASSPTIVAPHGPAQAIPVAIVTDDSRFTSITAKAPSKPPNGLYRFLLRRGRFGHSLVLCMIVILEWIQLYLPPLHHLLAALYLRFVPNFIQNPPPPPTYKPKPLSRKGLAKHADATALQQLQRIGNVSTAKYRHCSQAFLKRHGLGILSSTISGTAASGRGENAELIGVVSKVLGSRTSKTQGGKRRAANDDDDVGWIMNALTMNSHAHNDALAVSTAMYVDDDGMELSPWDKKRQSIQQALLQTTTRQRNKSRPVARTSDRDSGMLGRIRAGVGSNTMSRSLFGAYPGDAVPITEAANPNGVIELARRYGYGDWSDDDSDDDFAMQESDKVLARVNSSSPKLVKRSRIPTKSTRSSSNRRRKKKTSSPLLNVEFGFNVGGGGQSTSSTLANPNVVPRSIQPRAIRPSPVRDSRLSTNADERGRLKTSRTNMSAFPVHPTMSRLNALKSQQDHTMPRPAMERLNELRKQSKDGDA